MEFLPGFKLDLNCKLGLNPQISFESYQTRSIVTIFQIGPKPLKTTPKPSLTTLSLVQYYTSLDSKILYMAVMYCIAKGCKIPSNQYCMILQR